MNQIRKVKREDLQDLKAVLDSIELFPSEMLDDMISDYFDNPASTDLWFTYTDSKQALSIGYCGQEKLAEGTFNLYALGVKSGIHGKGIGQQMMAYIETQLRQDGQRLLIVETSGSDDFKTTREFYEKLNYTKEATIRDFWEEGDDKVIYWKKLV